MSSPISKIPRRIVTGHRNGIATILEDKQVTHVMKHESGFIVSDPWATDSMPVKDIKSAKIFDEFFPKLHPNGTLFRYVCIPPDEQVKQFFPPQEGQPHPLMHKNSISFTKCRISLRSH